ncbi:MAG: hypothetical protein WA139_00380 [Candidatus Aenigmatarchaeota archaeon]
MKADGRAGYRVDAGSEAKSSGTILFRLFYLGQCGCGFERKVERKIEVKEAQTLDDLCEAIILKSFGWDDPHSYSFFFDNKPFSQNRKMEYSSNTEEVDEFGKPNSTDVKLKNLKFRKGQKILFIFDFGDEHRFGIKVEGFGETQKGKKYPLILEEKGKAPEQYEEADEDEEAEEE